MLGIKNVTCGFSKMYINKNLESVVSILDSKCSNKFIGFILIFVFIPIKLQLLQYHSKLYTHTQFSVALVNRIALKNVLKTNFLIIKKLRIRTFSTIFGRIIEH